MGFTVISYRSAQSWLVRLGLRGDAGSAPRPTTDTVTTAVSGPGVTAPPVRRPAGRHRRPARLSGGAWRLLLAAGLTSLVLIGGTTALVVWERHMSTPTYTVEGYFDALADRDAEEAKALLAPGYDGNDGTDHFLLTGQVLRDPGYHPPHNVRVERMNPDSPDSMSNTNEADAVVIARYTVAGRPYRHELRLIPHDGGWLEHKWRIADPLLGMQIPRETGTPLVAGALFRPAGKPILVFPGAYTVTLPRQQLIGTEPVMLFAGSMDLVPLKPTLLPAGQAEIERQVRAYLDACAAGTHIKPEDCPFRDPVDPFAGLLSPRIVTYPTLRFEAGSSGELIVASVQPGQVEYTPRATPPTSQRVTTDFHVGGRARLSGDTLAFTRY